MSWTRGRGALLVVMNRDERRDRAAARPPRRWRGRGHAVGFTAPTDAAAGGTWIAVRDTGVVLALLNHHRPGNRSGPLNDSGVDRTRHDSGVDRSGPLDDSGVARARRDSGVDGAATRGGRPSRGVLVTTLAAESTIPDAARLRAAGLAAFAPFRLFVAGPSTPPRVFTWNGVTLTTRRLDPRRGFLSSSSWNPRGVIPARQATFRAFTRRHPRPTRDDLLALHAETTHPRGTPWAICMARDDARTVSTTVVESGPDGVTMRYRAR